jgi:hypothetical protein
VSASAVVMGRHRRARGRHADPNRHRGPDRAEALGVLAGVPLLLAAAVVVLLVVAGALPLAA